jgi:F-type H+-transporting ATPase subunit delta
MKTEQSVIAAPYAEALLKAAHKEGGDKLGDTVLSDLALINTVISSSPDFGKILNHPGIPLSDKRKAIIETFKSRVSDLALRLIELLLDKRRLGLLRSIEHEYHELTNKYKNIAKADLICAEPLNDKAIADIKARLAEHVGKKLEVTVKVDPSLIGGVVLRMGDQVMDGSLRGKLRNLERALLSV